MEGRLTKTVGTLDQVSLTFPLGRKSSEELDVKLFLCFFLPEKNLHSVTGDVGQGCTSYHALNIGAGFHFKCIGWLEEQKYVC